MTDNTATIEGTDTVEAIEPTAEATPETETVEEPAKPAKPDVMDGRSNGSATAIKLRHRVQLLTEKDMLDTEDGKKKMAEGYVTGIEYGRQRVVIKLDHQEKLIVRPASKVQVAKKNGRPLFQPEPVVAAAEETPAAE